MKYIKGTNQSGPIEKRKIARYETLLDLKGPDIFQDSDGNSNSAHVRIKRDKLDFNEDDSYETDYLRNLADSFPKSLNEMEDDGSSFEEAPLTRRRFKRLLQNTNETSLDKPMDYDNEAEENIDDVSSKDDNSRVRYNNLEDVYPEISNDQNRPVELAELIRRKRRDSSKVYPEYSMDADDSDAKIENNDFRNVGAENSHSRIDYENVDEAEGFDKGAQKISKRDELSKSHVLLGKSNFDYGETLVDY